MFERRVVIRDVNGMYGIGGRIPVDAVPLSEFTAIDQTRYRLIAVRDRYILYEPFRESAPSTKT